MTTEALSLRARPAAGAPDGKAGPVAVVVLAIVALWYLGAVLMNWAGTRDAFERAGAAGR